MEVRELKYEIQENIIHYPVPSKYDFKRFSLLKPSNYNMFGNYFFITSVIRQDFLIVSLILRNTVKIIRLKT